LYADNIESDEYTERYHQKADVWKVIRHLDDDAVWRMIRADAVDILVDLAGHTAGNRLGAIVVVTAGVVRRVVSVLTVVAAAVVAQVTFQHARADCPVVYQAQEVLGVEIFQLAEVVRSGQILGDLVVGTGVVELVAEFAGVIVGAFVRASNRQVFVVAGVTALGRLDLTSGQSQVFDFVRNDLAALEGLRQQATVVGLDHRVVWLQGAPILPRSGKS